MRWGTLAEFGGFQLACWVCAIGAAHGASAPGIAVATIFVALQIFAQRNSAAIWPSIAAAGLLGLCAEILLVTCGFVNYAAAWPSIGWAPAWVVALWMALGTTLGSLHRLLGQHTPMFTAALGAVLGPVSYVAGASFGALQLVEPRSAGLLTIAIIWAFALPLLLFVQKRAQGAPNRATS